MLHYVMMLQPQNLENAYRANPMNVYHLEDPIIHRSHHHSNFANFYIGPRSLHPQILLNATL